MKIDLRYITSSYVRKNRKVKSLSHTGDGWLLVLEPGWHCNSEHSFREKNILNVADVLETQVAVCHCNECR